MRPFTKWKNSSRTLKAYNRSSTSRGQTPASSTAWILSLGPSERYDRAQQASVRTSSSFKWMSCRRTGNAGFTWHKPKVKKWTQLHIWVPIDVSSISNLVLHIFMLTLTNKNSYMTAHLFKWCRWLATTKVG